VTIAEGVLLVDKPAGPTSHDVVALARKAFGIRRVGHTGTLDPFATGLLLLCVGRATRLAELFHLLSKRYVARVHLGLETDTLDPTGEITGRSDTWRGVDRSSVVNALQALQGDVLQEPPVFSAKKRKGERAHRMARDGRVPRLEPVRVRVHGLRLVSLDLPFLELEAEVGTGTYVRALARDLGRILGCGAHLATLRRTAIGPFDVDRALEADRLREQAAGGDEPFPAGAWLPPVGALSWLPRRHLDGEEAARVAHGSAVPLGRVEIPAAVQGVEDPETLPIALLGEGELIAVARREGEILRPTKVLRAA
jgi:tRNA pseudouridine55 synthase